MKYLEEKENATFLAPLFHMIMPRQSKKGQTSIMKWGPYLVH